ncbi:CBM20 domain-containing protein [Akkermansiaceae bacterium]|nr:CBM20 domain-containing protein [Akkermansiaceae bacterium]MDA7639371.1 CBM20 domain-containing protein [Akkermansiaceae bacterium]MDB4355357.1 CBM20 domain-containing protein [Akkermansiaceae bacterium]MDB4504133.1 CBM20 domain-containing protein [Akkermansiaceae bacterium]MDB4666168.1 CBM20 domain-containing protein [Akkermansiaceae bacterium]
MRCFLSKLGLVILPCLFSFLAEAQTTTFRVDMSVQIAIGRYDPGNDLLMVRGPFNSWVGTDLTFVAGSNFIYEAEIDIFETDGAQADFKFFIASVTSGDIWEGNVGTGENGNRRFNYQAGGQILETVFFDDLETNPGGGVKVTFQVNMAPLLQDGLFLPEFDWLEVRGAFNSWAAGFELEPISEGSPIYAGSTTIKSIAPGDSVEYKYVYNGGQWENGSNRKFILAEQALQVLPIRYFSDIRPDSSLTEDTKIVISVNMNNALALNGTPFNLETDRVYINGEFSEFTWWEWSFPPDGFELLDDGTAESGDAVEGDGIYSIKFQALAGQPKRIEYKFSINGEDSEADFQNNHIRYIRETGNYPLPVDQFGNMVHEPEVLSSNLGVITINGPVDGMVTLSWENTDAVLQHSESLAPSSWQNIPNSQGDREMVFSATEISKNYFRLATP